MKPVYIAYLALGSNLGDRLASLTEAIDRLHQHDNIEIDFQSGLSSIYKTSPVGVTDHQQDYYNAVVQIETSLKPAELLQACSKIENQIGRVRTKCNASRVIDIDLLMFEDFVMDTDSLSLPHPRMHERLFVLTPLCEIAGDLIYPATGKSIRTLNDEWVQHNVNVSDYQSIEFVERIQPAGWFQHKEEMIP